MASVNLLYKDHYDINDKITIMIPTVRDVLNDEENYYSLVSILTATPMDFMILLDDAGIDYTEVSEYELFLMLFPSIRDMDTHLIFGDLDLRNFSLAVSKINNTTILLDSENDIVIDRAIQGQIAAALRAIHHLKKDTRRPGNEAAKKYLLERARTKAKRNKNKKFSSELEPMIVSLVNTEQYKYDYEGTKELSIYQFNVSVKQTIQKINYDSRMFGVYMGTVDASKLSDKDLDWMHQD